MIVLVNKYLLAKGYTGFAFWPFVVVKDKALKKDIVFLNHERIHLQQQKELLIIPFYIWYVIEYFIRLLQYRNAFLAYRNISFEREAYAEQTNLIYLTQRKLFSFRHYL